MNRYNACTVHVGPLFAQHTDHKLIVLQPTHLNAISKSFQSKWPAATQECEERERQIVVWFTTPPHQF